MRELSLNVMDVVQNSISAEAKLITVSVTEDTSLASLEITITDNGRGMTAEQVQSVTNPFYTTRTTRKVGLGVPFFKMSSEQTGGNFSIKSEVGKGTAVTAKYDTSHIDMTPLGDINSTILLLVTCNPELDFVYERSRDGKASTLDTRELREALGEEVALNSPDVTAWIKGFLEEGEAEVLGGE